MVILSPTTQAGLTVNSLGSSLPETDQQMTWATRTASLSLSTRENHSYPLVVAVPLALVTVRAPGSFLAWEADSRGECQRCLCAPTLQPAAARLCQEWPLPAPELGDSQETLFEARWSKRG